MKLGLDAESGGQQDFFLCHLEGPSYWTFLIQILEFTEAFERACPGPHKAEQSQYVTPYSH